MTRFVKPDMFFVHCGTLICFMVLLEGILLYWMQERRKVLKLTTKARVLRIVNEQHFMWISHLQNIQKV